MKKLIIKAIILLIATSSNCIAEVPGKTIAYACYSCHDEKLDDLKQAKKLSVEKLSNILLALKANNQQSTIMGRITKGFSDGELIAVARYIGQ